MSHMSVNCKDRERIFENGSDADWAALEAHAGDCADCREEIRAWKAVGAAAEQLRDYSPSPALWRRIEQSLEAQALPEARRRGISGWLGDLAELPRLWQSAAVVAMVVLLIAFAAWVRPRKTGPGLDKDAQLLNNPALAEVERTEAAYIEAIDKLAVEAKPDLDNPATPLLASYKEKLLVLDSAIEDLRLQAGLNPSNAHLRRELLAMYQEKQRTLEDVLEIKR
jgi:hypothetical protein